MFSLFISLFFSRFKFCVLLSCSPSLPCPSLLPGAPEEQRLRAAAVMAGHRAGAVRVEPFRVPPPVPATEGLRPGPVTPHRSVCWSEFEGSSDALPC